MSLIGTGFLIGFKTQMKLVRPGPLLIRSAISVVAMLIAVRRWRTDVQAGTVSGGTDIPRLVRCPLFRPPDPSRLTERATFSIAMVFISAFVLGNDPLVIIFAVAS